MIKAVKSDNFKFAWANNVWMLGINCADALAPPWVCTCQVWSPSLSATDIMSVLVSKAKNFKVVVM
jgi:hypothetical protein